MRAARRDRRPRRAPRGRSSQSGRRGSSLPSSRSSMIEDGGEGLRDRADAVLRARRSRPRPVPPRRARAPRCQTIAPSRKTAAETDGIRSRTAPCEAGARAPRESGSGCGKDSQGARDRLDRAVDVVVLDPEVRREHGGRPVGACRASTPCAAIRARASAVVDPERGRRRAPTKFVSTASGSTGRPAVGQPLGEPPRARVVLGEPLDVVVERVERRRGDHPGLAHRAAEQELPLPGLPRSAPRSRRASRPAGSRAPSRSRAVTVSASRPYSAAGMPLATDALSSRAPSRWTARPSSRAVGDRRRSSSSGHTRPPALRCVCSSTTMLAGCSSSAGDDRLAQLLGRDPPGDRPGRPRMTSPEWTAGPPASKTRMCVRSSAISWPPGRVSTRSAIWFAIVAVGRKSARLVPEQLGRSALELVDGRILAQLLVADLGRGHRGAHALGSASSRCRSGGRSRR